MPASKDARQILQTIIEDGRNELSRAGAGLALSGLAAGLNISFGAIAMVMAGTKTGEIGLVAMALYPVGFIIVILGRAQLFTENTVTPVTVVLAEPRRRFPSLLKLWGIVLLSNLVGAFCFALAIVQTDLLSAEASKLLFEEVSEKLGYGFWPSFAKAIFGGWIVALMAWLVAADQDTISQIATIWMLAFLIPLLGLAHSIAGASEVMIAVLSGESSWIRFLLAFQVPVTLGNILGGVVLVAILNYGQVVQST